MGALCAWAFRLGLGAALLGLEHAAQEALEPVHERRRAQRPAGAFA